MPITEQHTEESLCLAHIYALAGIAGLNYSAQKFDYGIDGQFSTVVRRGTRLISSGYPLDYQAKATTDWVLLDSNIVYDLEAKTYNDIVSRTASETTLILILLCLPKDRTHWHEATTDCTVLRHCCYYWYPNGVAPTSNEYKKRIYIPSTNILTPASLADLMELERARRQYQLS